MRRHHVILTSAVVAFCMLLPVAGHASDIQSLTARAQQAASAGNNTQALGILELAMSQSAGQPDSVFGPLEGQYWRLIAKEDNFPRAMSFFTALTGEQKVPGATLLATEASSIGGYIGWLHQNRLIDSVPQAALEQMDAKARGAYNRALALDPDNFTALYGFAIYESYSPNGKAHMQQLLAKLNSLRSSHPQYPWSLVDYLEQHGHPQD